MTRGTRFALLGAALAIAIAAIVIAVASGGDNNNDKNDKSTTVKTKPQVTQIRVVNGKPVGGITKINAKKGDRVRFTVSSDVADEVHVHGYDFMKDVPAGGSISFSFPAKIAGSFEIELEGRKEQIAALKVEP